MEPMALGSPPSSPTPTNTNYLPPFLMGGGRKTPSSAFQTPERSGYMSSLNHSHSQHQYSSGPFESQLNPQIQSPHGGYQTAIQSQNGIQSPHINQSASIFNSNSQASTSYQPSQSFTGSNASALQSPTVDVSFNRTSGPPKVGLFDTLENKSYHTPTLSRRQSLHTMNEETLSTSFNQYGVNKSVHGTDSLNNFDVNYETNSTVWVTVFGFPASALNLVMARLVNCGTVEERIAPTQGNWLYVKFSSPYEAAKALSLNGKLVTNSIMIGVVPYYNKQDKENTLVAPTPCVTPIRARSLRQSLVSPQFNNSLVKHHNTPQKQTGFVTKALDYVLGW